MVQELVLISDRERRRKQIGTKIIEKHQEKECKIKRNDGLIL